ncbi:MAG: AraC family transcriptional regulator [Cyanobacteria bacterium P01_F01_bin.150]
MILIVNKARIVLDKTSGVLCPQISNISMSTYSKISFTSTDFQDMLAEFQQQIALQDVGATYRTAENENAWELRNSFGIWSGQAIDLRDGLDLSMIEFDIREHLRLITEAQMEPLFGLSFCVTGGFFTNFPGLAAEYTACANEVYAGFFPGTIKAVSEFAAGRKSTLVQMRISPHLFETFAEVSSDQSQAALAQMLADTQTGLHWQTRKTTPAMMLALYQILHCPYHGLTKRFYLESKTLELIALKLHQFNEQLPLPATSTLKPDDIDRIYVARDILIRDLEDPPSLLVLAKQAGINSFKLKQGFRQIFNTTVFGYLHAYRMEEARRLLEIGGLNVTQVAQRVGYAHPGKFSAAFKKKFGISPKALKSR